MTLSELEIMFRTKVGDLVVPYTCPSVTFRAYLNAAEREACRRTRLIFDSTTEAVCEITVTTGNQVFNLPTTILEIVRAYLIDASGDHINLVNTDKTELDRLFPDWRTTTKTPGRYMVEETTIELDSIADEDYTLKLEVYRLPIANILLPTDSPEIAPAHHERLLDWCAKEYNLLSDPVTAQFYTVMFEGYFGVEKTASGRRRSRENVPQHNKVW